MSAPSRLRLRLLGGFSLERDANPCKLQYEKGRAILAYLVMEPTLAHSRESLAAKFWPNLDRQGALANLRQVMHNLRQTLNTANAATSGLEIQRDSVRLYPSASMEVDVAGFLAPAPICPITPCREYCWRCLEQMESLVDAYRGEFMLGFCLAECEDFEDWLQVQRKALLLRVLALLARLSDCHDRVNNQEQALAFALRFLELEQWNEEGLRRVMRLLALSGQSAMALARFDACTQSLQKEYGAAPVAETCDLAVRIRRGELSPTTRRREDLAPPGVPLAPTGERRQITVVCCDLTCIDVDDPDEALARLQPQRDRCEEIIRRHLGYPVQVLGGSLLAYFGYPQANEKAARLAVEAALAMSRSGCAGVEARASVHTGIVITHPQVPDAIGTVSALASRLCQLANCSELVISEASRRLVTGYFECTSVGCIQLPGDARQLGAFRVDGEIGAEARLDAAAKLTPLVGRRNETATLLAAWQDACNGVQRIVLLRGEAGIGKSRLLHGLKETRGAQECVIRELRCFLEHSRSALYPLATLFAASMGFAAEDSPETKFAKLADFAANHYSRADPRTVPLLARMLSLPVQSPYREATGSPQQKREETLTILLDHLHELTASAPVLLVIEDLHWADPSTLELLNRFVQQDRAIPLLLVLTARPQFQPPWSDGQALILTLNGLNDSETEALVEAVAPTAAPATVRRIVERADGIPLFAEELARDIAANDHSAIPPTLRDLLAARLGALGPAKPVAQLAATIGREFSLSLLQRASRLDAATLTRLLRQLCGAGILHEEAGLGFQFRHALIRDAAYQSQTRVEREAAHRRIAAELHATGACARPELVALHEAAGGQVREAIACWIEAGKLASQTLACQEAVLHYKSGLALIEMLPEQAERLRLELDLQIGLGTASCAAEGYASVEGATAYARATELCLHDNNCLEMFPATWGLWASASSRTSYADAIELARQLLRMAEASGDRIHDQQSHFAVADTQYWLGEFVTARRHLERVGACYQSSDHDRHIIEFGEDAGVTSAAYHSWVLWFLGYPDQAREASERAVALARQLGHAFSLGYALTFATLLRCRLRQPDAALALAQETLSLSSEHGFPLWQIGATLAHGWALAMSGRREGVDVIRQCVEAMGAAMGGAALVVMEPLVDACVEHGLFEEALQANTLALAVGNAVGDHHVDGELHRLKGELLLGLSSANQTDAAACFQQALDISRRQQARALELRAAMSLARLWKEQGKRDDARRLLEDIYRWFTEGFDTPDLQNARELLDSLGPSIVDGGLARDVAGRVSPPARGGRKRPQHR
jgi:DNA-binding SARP family transcriptional activator/predicted ATPase